MKIIACTKHLKEKFNNKRLSAMIKVSFLKMAKYIIVLRDNPKC